MLYSGDQWKNGTDSMGFRALNKMVEFLGGVHNTQPLAIPLTNNRLVIMFFPIDLYLSVI